MDEKDIKCQHDNFDFLRSSDFKDEEILKEDSDDESSFSESTSSNRSARIAARRLNDKANYAHMIVPGLVKNKTLGSGSFGTVWSLAKGIAPANTIIVRTPTLLLAAPSAVSCSTFSEKSSSIGGTSKLVIHANLFYEYSEQLILKISNLGSPSIQPPSGAHGERDPLRFQDSFDREIYYLELLRETGAVPRLVASMTVQNGEIGLQLMEKFTGGTVKSLGRRQARAFGGDRGTVAYTEPQLKEMARLASLLDESKIIHGDLKHTNMLVQNSGILKWETKDMIPKMVISDFGFAGGLGEMDQYSPLIGWMRVLGCSPTRKRIDFIDHISPGNPKPAKPQFYLQTPIPLTLRPVFNRCQLYLSMFQNWKCRLLLWTPTSKKRKYKAELKQLDADHLAKIMGLTPAILAELAVYCPKVKERKHIHDERSRREIRARRKKKEFLNQGAKI